MRGFFSSVMLIGIILGLSCDAKIVRIEPKEIFKEIFSFQQPESVTNIQVDKNCALDCFLWARFQSAKDFKDLLTRTGFQLARCNEYFYLMEDGSMADRFKPAWKPKITPMSECYAMRIEGQKRAWLKIVLRDVETGETHAIAFTVPPKEPPRPHEKK